MSITAKLCAALGLIMLLISSHWYAYQSGNRNGTNAVLVGTLQASNKALTERIKSNESESNKLAEDAKKASKDHASEIKTVRDAAIAHAGKRVPIDPNICRGSAGSPESAAPGSDGQGTASGAFLPEQFTGDLRQAAAKADEIVADMRHFIRRANEAGCFQ